MATQIHNTPTRTDMPFPITHTIPVIPVPWLLLVQSRVGRKKVKLSGCTFSSSAHMTAVPSDITAAEEGGGYRQWSTEGLGASSRVPDSIINNHRLSQVCSRTILLRHSKCHIGANQGQRNFFKGRMMPQDCIGVHTIIWENGWLHWKTWSSKECKQSYWAAALSDVSEGQWSHCCVISVASYIKTHISWSQISLFIEHV